MTNPPNEEKKLVFKKGYTKLVFPFLLHEFSPWQSQIAAEMDKVKGIYAPRKNVEWGYRIENGRAEIYVQKT